MLLENNLADHGKRFSSFIIDLLTIQIIVFIIIYFFFDNDHTLSLFINQKVTITPKILFLKERNIIKYISFGIWMLYCIVMETSKFQGTYGKKIMNIKVVDHNGNRLSFSKSLLRNLSKIISYLCLGFGFFWILFDKKNQGWHDKISATFVVNKYFQNSNN